MRIFRNILVWLLVYSMVALPAAARTTASTASPGDQDLQTDVVAMANPRCEAEVEKATAALSRCLSKQPSKETRNSDRRGWILGDESDDSEASPLGECGSKFERRIQAANQKFDRCSAVHPTQIQEHVYHYTQQSEHLAQGLSGETAYYAFDTDSIGISRYGDSFDSPDSEPEPIELVLSGIETSNLLKIKERPSREITETTWDEFLGNWTRNGVEQPIHVIVAGGSYGPEGQKVHCMAEMKFSAPTDSVAGTSATWSGSLLETSETCPDEAHIDMDQTSVIIGPVVIGAADQDVSKRFTRDIKEASGKRATCHLRAQARMAKTGKQGQLDRSKARCEKNFERSVARAARKNRAGDFLSDNRESFDLNIQRLTEAVTQTAQGTRTGEWNYGIGAGLATLADNNTLHLSVLDAPGLTSYRSDSDYSHETLTWNAFLDRWDRHASALAISPPQAVLGGSYEDEEGNTQHCSLSLELLDAPQIGTQKVAWAVNVLDRGATCPTEVSLEDAFLFAHSETADTEQVTGIYSSDSAPTESPFPVEGREGVYTASVTATIPAYCHDCDDCYSHDYSNEKEVAVYVYNFTLEKMELKNQHYARGVSAVDRLSIGDVNPMTRSRFAYNYRNNEQGDCKGNVTSVGYLAASYFEYQVGDTPFAINLNSAQPNPPPNRTFWEEIGSWWSGKPLWEKIVYALLAVFFVASVIATDGVTLDVAEVGADLDIILNEEGGVEILDQLIPEGEAVLNADEFTREQLAMILDDVDLFEGLDAFDQYWNYNGGLIQPLTADDVLLEGGAPSNLGDLADLEVSQIENFEAEDEMANVAAQNRTSALSGFARSILWTRATARTALIGESIILGLDGLFGAGERYISSHQTLGAGFPKVDVRPDQSAHYFQQANVNGEAGSTEVLFADNTQYGVRLDGKYVVAVQSGMSEFRGFTANQYMPAPGPLNVLSISVFPLSAEDGPANQDGLAKTYRMTAAAYIPKSTEDCPKDCGLAIDRDGVVREIHSPSDESPWAVSEVHELDSPLSTYSVTPTDSAPNRIYIGLSDGTFSRLDITTEGDVTETFLGSFDDAAPTLIRPHNPNSTHLYVALSDGTIMANSSPETLPNENWHTLSGWDDSSLVHNMGQIVRGPEDRVCSEPDAEAPASCYWLDWSNGSGCWKPSPSSYPTPSSCADASENCNSGGGCYQWVSDPSGYFGTSHTLTVTTADGTIYEGLSHDAATGDYASFSKLRSGDGGEGLETAIFADNQMFSFFSNQESHGCHCHDLWVGDFCPDTCRSSHFNIESTSLDDLDSGSCRIVKQAIVDTDSKPKVGAYNKRLFIGTEDDGDYDLKRFDPEAPCAGAQESYADRFEVLKSEPVTAMSATPKGLWVGLKNGSILHYDSHSDMKLLASNPSTGDACSSPGAEGTGCYWLSNKTGCWESSNPHFTESEEACQEIDSCSTGGACYSYVESWSDKAVESIVPGPHDLSAIVSVRRPGYAVQKRMLTCQTGHTDCTWHDSQSSASSAQ